MAHNEGRRGVRIAVDLDVRRHAVVGDDFVPDDVRDHPANQAATA
ncbi:MAG: hypothetical protein ABIQ18_13620 [Umezawaea sp.]